MKIMVGDDPVEVKKALVFHFPRIPRGIDIDDAKKEMARKGYVITVLTMEANSRKPGGYFVAYYERLDSKAKAKKAGAREDREMKLSRFATAGRKDGDGDGDAGESNP